MKDNNAQLILKFPDADTATIERLKRLLVHYTGKLTVKTECDAPKDDDADGDSLGMDAGPETTTTAELTVKLTPAAAAWLLQNISDDATFWDQAKKCESAISALEKATSAKPRMKKGA